MAEQKKLLSHNKAEAYWPAMTLPPPSPSSDDSWLASAPTNVSHPGIPHLLQIQFSPHAASILSYANANDTTQGVAGVPVQPVYGSMEEWANLEAQHLTAANPSEMQMVAQQLKAWACSSQDSEVQTAVTQAKGEAVSLAAQAAAQKRARQGSLGAAQSPGNVASSPVDLSAYATHYRAELK